MCVVLVHNVDDICIASQYKNEIKELKEKLILEFDMNEGSWSCDAITWDRHI